MEDSVFAGSIPELYERLLVPLIFEPYALDLAGRLAVLRPARVLEIAAGTGVATRAMARAIDGEIVATDLNPAMIERAREVGTSRAVEWQHADALELPFPDASFDAVVCQFGAMFFPDKPKGYAEARRVLRPGGTFLFSVWDRIEDNEFADVVTRTLEPLFPSNPPRFLARTPHGHHDRDTIARDVAAIGFGTPEIAIRAERSRAATAEVPSIAYCQGTPLRNEIGEARLLEATAACERAIADRFGPGPVDGKIQALIVMLRR